MASARDVVGCATSESGHCMLILTQNGEMRTDDQRVYLSSVRLHRSITGHRCPPFYSFPSYFDPTDHIIHQ
jgi:hypothetical protein